MLNILAFFAFALRAFTLRAFTLRAFTLRAACFLGPSIYLVYTLYML
jgi:hypothetical protein